MSITAESMRESVSGQSLGLDLSALFGVDETSISGVWIRESKQTPSVQWVEGKGGCDREML